MSNDIKDVKKSILTGVCTALHIGKDFYIIDKLDLSENIENFTGSITLNGDDGSFNIVLPKMSKTVVLWKYEAVICRQILNFILSRYDINKLLS